jgi:hypothetical protein
MRWYGAAGKSPGRGGTLQMFQIPARAPVRKVVTTMIAKIPVGMSNGGEGWLRQTNPLLRQSYKKKGAYC